MVRRLLSYDQRNTPGGKAVLDWYGKVPQGGNRCDGMEMVEQQTAMQWRMAHGSQGKLGWSWGTERMAMRST